MHKRLLLLLLGIFVSFPVFAKNLGKVGQVYPIKEIDLLDFIQMRLQVMQQNGDLKKINQEMVDKAKKHADRPLPVTGISDAKSYKRWDIDPSVMIPYDLKDHNGAVLAQAGTVINPLTKVSLKEALIFFNGDDREQVAWVSKVDQALHGKDKLILVNGSVLEQGKFFKRNIFFDQQGRLTNKFKIGHVPAMVRQEGLHLRVEEFEP